MDFTERHAEFVGLHFGDGSLIWRPGTDRLRFQLRGDAREDKPHYEQFIIPLCNEIIGPFLGKAVCTVLDRKKNWFGVSTESNKIKPLFDCLKIPIGVKNELEIPKWIKKSKNFSKAFVRGLFDTDGGLDYRRNNTSKSKLQTVGRASICTTSRTLAIGTSEIFNSIDIKHYLRSFSKHNGEKNYYKVESYRPHHREFMKIVGSHNPKHLTKFQIEEKYGFCPSRTNLKQRQQILKGELNPFSLVKAGV